MVQLFVQDQYCDLGLMAIDIVAYYNHYSDGAPTS